MKHASLFSGIGGFDLAAEWAGWENKFHCEWNEFGQKVLNYYWPKAISYGDITKTDFTIWRGRIDVLTGGFPCQPYSLAGKRLGKEDERHLWPEMLRAIREIQPKWVVGENVLGITNWNGGLVFNEVQSDLEAEGYEVQSYVLPAAGINAPHKRERVWFIAKNTKCDGFVCREFEQEGTENGQFGNIGTRDSNGIRGQKNAGTITRSNDKRRSTGLGEIQAENGEIPKRNKDAQFSNAGTGFTPDTESQRHQFSRTGNKELSASPGPGLYGRSGFKFSKCGTWENFPTQSPVCSRNDGISDRLDGITFSKWRNESIKAYGNAIVPGVVYRIFKAINEYENAGN